MVGKYGVLRNQNMVYILFFFEDVNNGWGAGGLSNGIFRTNDGGITWGQRVSNINEYARFYSPKNNSNIYLFGLNDTIYTYKAIVDINNSETNLPPTEFVLYQNYPNPFNPSTAIKYTIPKQSNVSLKVFDILGDELSTLIDGEQSEGNYDIMFDASEFPSGIYFYRLNAGEFAETKKMLIIK